MIAVAASLAAGEEIAPGASRESVVAKYGAPSGAIAVGSREILTYPKGRITLENGVVKSADWSENDSPPTRTSASPAGRSGRVGWLSDIDEANAQAAAQNKLILVLITGDMSACPWGTQFNQSIQSSTSFVGMMASEFVLLRIDLSSLGGDVSSREEFERKKREMERIADLRKRVTSSEMIPAMALITADGKRVAKVNMDGAVKAKGDMLNFTLRAIKEAKAKPLVAAHPGGGRKSNVPYLSLAVIGGLIGFYFYRRSL
jgi:hypothetical protein